MMPGSIAFDVDGTITRRNGTIGAGMARLFRELMREGWRLVALTGQALENVRPRVLEPVRAVSEDAFEMSVYTCEGARLWSFGPDGPSAVFSPRWFSSSEREDLSARTAAMLADLAASSGARVLEKPVWWEESLLVFKVGPETLDRGALVQQIAVRLDVGRCGLRVGAAGRTTIVITRSLVHKGRALREIRHTTPAGAPVLYLADEFTLPGNDRVALDVRGIFCVSVGETLADPRIMAQPGLGPRGAFRFLSALARSTRKSSVQIDLQADSSVIPSSEGAQWRQVWHLRRPPSHAPEG
jgi:hypothetical protein